MFRIMMYDQSILQMWASFLAERDGSLDGRFGCVTPREAQMSQRISKPRSNPTLLKGRSLSGERGRGRR